MVTRNFVVLTDVFGRGEYMSITRRSFGRLMGASFGMVALRALHFLRIVMLTLRMAWPAVTPKGPSYTLDQE